MPPILNETASNYTGNIITNTAVGGSALNANTTGSELTSTGYFALKANTTGSANTAIGTYSANATTTGSNNTAAGSGSLATNTTGSNNVAIGKGADVAAGDLTNAIAIGYNAVASGSNKIQLGNSSITEVTTSGAVKGKSFVKEGGTATQYLMADGSVSNGGPTQADVIVAMQAQIAAMQAQINSLLSPVTTTMIGTQSWTTKNLNVTTYRDGTPIPEVQDGEAWANLTTGAWCHLNNDPANDAIYGKMYNHYAVEDPRGLAPTGYHIPTQAEWFTLFETAGGWYSCSPKLRSTVFNGTDDYGFSVLNGGSRSGNAQEMWFPGEPMIPAGTFQTSTAMFWSSDVLPQYTGAYFGDWNATGTSDFPNNYGAYIRLIKN